MPSSSLEDHKIFKRHEKTRESLDECPQRLKDFLTLILNVRSLKWDYFGGTLGGNRSVHATPIMQYQSELKSEADELAATCRDPERLDDLEEKWVELLGVVFYRFDRAKEEIYARKRHHHCFICGKHFPLRSRPLLNKYTSRVYDGKLRTVHGSDKDTENADVCLVHKNIPNFTIDKLTFKSFEGEGKKIPDRTIGLLAWSENSFHPPPNMDESEMNDILEHPSVEPFCNDVLHDLKQRGLIEPPFEFPKSKEARATRSSLTFPFAMWEAKKASEPDPVSQNALKVKMILEWQRAVADRANIEWEPLVFHFVSMGSEWKVYACHIQLSPRKLQRTYPFRLLWSGDCVNPEMALQLLYLVDLVALWGQFQYKPFAGACIQVLREDDGISFLEQNLLEHQKDITTSNFPSIRSIGISPIDVIKPYIKLRRAGTDTSIAQIEQDLLQGLRKLSLKDYYIPEKDGFIWLMHRQLRGRDLIVIRINTGGSVLQPLIIFNTQDWKSEEFRKIIYEERARMPQNVETDFKYDKKGKSFLRKCFDADEGYCTGHEIQFCAILPLKRESEPKGRISPYNGLQPLVNLLDLPTLIAAAQRENQCWCTCRQAETQSMILCDATTCATGWYHKSCVGVIEDSQVDHWLCPACIADIKSGNNIKLSNYDNAGVFGDETHAKSDARIQRVRSLGRAWKEHHWPHPSEVRRMMYEKICPRIEMETSCFNTVGCLLQDENLPKTRCWAVERGNPAKMTRIRSRFRRSRIS